MQRVEWTGGSLHPHLAGTGEPLCHFSLTPSTGSGGSSALVCAVAPPSCGMWTKGSKPSRLNPKCVSKQRTIAIQFVCPGDTTPVSPSLSRMFFFSSLYLNFPQFCHGCLRHPLGRELSPEAAGEDLRPIKKRKTSRRDTKQVRVLKRFLSSFLCV